MYLFVSLTQISGIGIEFFTLRLIIILLFTGAEVNLDNRLTPKQDHIIITICEYRRDSTVLLGELEELGIEYILIASGEENAKDFSDAGYSVIHGSPQDRRAFERASIDAARAVITDAEDANVNTILTVQSITTDIGIITLTDDSGMRSVLLDAGADTVLSPHGVLGRRLAEKAVSSFSSELTDTIELGSEMEITEIPIQPGNQLVGARVRNSGIREQTGANIIGAWIDGELQLPPNPDAVIRSNTVLLLSGAHDELEAFDDFTQSYPYRTLRRHERVIIAGQGEVGQAAREIVVKEGLDVTTIDVEDHDSVDIVGDASSNKNLQAAEIETAGAIIVGLPDDSASLLTTVLARSLNSDIEILTRVSDIDATQKALSAGADYVLPVPRVSARMVVSELRGEDILAPASQIRLLRVPADPLVGSTLAESSIYEEAGYRIIAVEDDSGLTSTVDPQRRFTGDERIVLVGSREAIQEFRKQFNVSMIEPEA
ncbi:potassium channel family protein [Haloquadratum walsbyi]|uniref:potassium channel family protein n=1 Tax=Haloquadratum walsbyi TaxID=293091 RepID=UPI0006775E70|nr:NAD-binding protein [Haloquadratum walsbyi]